MAKLFVKAQATSSRSEYVFVQDSASSTGGGKTGIAFNASGLTAYYVRPLGSATVITLATQTVTGVYASGGFVEVDATNLPGTYRFDIPNAVFATGVDHAVVMLKGASGMAPVLMEYQLTSNDPFVPSALVNMGPYQIKADGLGSSQPLDINVGAAQGIDTQVVDANGSGVDITSSTLSVKVYDSGGILVATYAGTATYAADGRLTFAITTAVTGTAGTYTATITRTTSASDTQVFGPLRLYVRSV